MTSKKPVKATAGTNLEPRSCQCDRCEPGRVVLRARLGLRQTEEQSLEALRCVMVQLSSEGVDHHDDFATSRMRSSAQGGSPAHRHLIRQLAEAIRRWRNRPFCFMTPGCQYVLQDELDVLALVRATRHFAPQSWRIAAEKIAGHDQVELLISAARTLAALQINIEHSADECGEHVLGERDARLLN